MAGPAATQVPRGQLGSGSGRAGPGEAGPARPCGGSNGAGAGRRQPVRIRSPVLLPAEPGQRLISPRGPRGSGEHAARSTGPRWDRRALRAWTGGTRGALWPPASATRARAWPRKRHRGEPRHPTKGRSRRASARTDAGVAQPLWGPSGRPDLAARTGEHWQLPAEPGQPPVRRSRPRYAAGGPRRGCARP